MEPSDVILDIIVFIVPLVAALLLFALVWKSIKKGGESLRSRHYRCSACGWQGTVSGYVPRCPTCNRPIDEGESGAGR